ncbi:hypothetical protein D3C87_1791580 [compost metagenome]
MEEEIGPGRHFPLTDLLGGFTQGLGATLSVHRGPVVEVQLFAAFHDILDQEELERLDI